MAPNCWVTRIWAQILIVFAIAEGGQAFCTASLQPLLPKLLLSPCSRRISDGLFAGRDGGEEDRKMKGEETLRS
jgi:hypothetical protein